MILFILCVILGLLDCFGGIYMKKFCAFVTGFVWGALLTRLIVILTMGNTFLVIAGGLLTACLCPVFKKFSAFVNGAFPTFCAIWMALWSLKITGTFSLDPSAEIIISLIGALLVGILCTWGREIPFMLQTAFTGAFLTFVGIFFLVERFSTNGESAVYMLGNSETAYTVFLWPGDSENLNYILLATLLVGAVGFGIQMMKLLGEKKTEKEEENTAPALLLWKCACGYKNSDTLIFCEGCGKKRLQDVEMVAPDEEDAPDVKSSESASPPPEPKKTWTCSCGEVNDEVYVYCRRCGESHGRAKWICWVCGAPNAEGKTHCSECGALADRR